jgi:predicted Zn-dependent protease
MRIQRLMLMLCGAGLIFVAGCQTVDMVGELGAAVGQATGAITAEEAESIKKTTAAVGKTFDSITPRQEYYIGRSVAASVLETYKPYDKAAANAYLNLLGQTLARFSDRPETFGGYHFLVLDTDDITAFSAPGGLVLVSRGLVRCCPNEDALAAVLAHEIGHVELKHGLRAIRTGRLTSALTIIAAESAKTLGSDDLAELTKAFEGSVTDITKTLMNSGYSRNLELEADQVAVTIMRRAGYNPEALVVMLQEMGKQLVAGKHDFGATHPPPSARIRKLRTVLGPSASVVQAPAPRQKRFTAAVGKI